jgi:hypothetical protein
VKRSVGRWFWPEGVMLPHLLLLVLHHFLLLLLQVVLHVLLLLQSRWSLGCRFDSWRQCSTKRLQRCSRLKTWWGA